MAGISLDGVTKFYPDGTRAVPALDLDVPDGSLMVLVGPSGCGKTTVLLMVAGLEEVSEGTIRIGDRVVNDSSPRTGTSRWCSRTTPCTHTCRSTGTWRLGCRCGGSPAEIDRRVRVAARLWS